MKGKWVRDVRSGIMLLMVVMFVIGLTACGGSSKDSNAVAPAAGEAAPGEALKQGDSISVTSSDQISSQKSLQFSEAAPAAKAEASSAPEAPAEGGNQSGGSDLSAVGGGIGEIADANAGFDRKVIYRANLVMKVEEFKTAEEQLLNLIHLGGAYVLQFSDSRSADEVGATYVIKVPSSGFSPFLEKLQKIKTLHREREVEGSDVTEEFVDLNARLKAKQVVESRLLAFMDKAAKTDDLVRFSNELARVQEEIEQIKGRIRFLDQNVAFSTINLRLYQATGIEEIKEEKVDEKQTFSERISDALAGSTKVLRQFGEGVLVVVAALLPVLIVLTVLGIPTFYFVSKRRSVRRAVTEEKRKAWNSSLVPVAETEKAIPETPPEVKPDPDEQEPNDGIR
ncbi:DUF4349 domain-containing protein [Cohnella silvisoli]|uniref:DUF4349 domain-containing protein n=1 Tax=Cohnella silvisoli TaxID=2873699 RepID=A0ABV1KYM0_9BACL|nr:DUF4349 domain-containing protein [Cohnella silvisoli]MCD9024440.1 DUF4349 domain-containing protein [Cohnella silvisoli]